MKADTDRIGAWHPVRVVSRRTGLSPDVLRAWERRYGVVTPVRSSGGQRLYSEADVARLALLHRATRAGHNIGDIARLPDADLRALIAAAVADEMREDAPSGSPEPSPGRIAAHLEECIRSVRGLNGAELEKQLKRGALVLSPHRFAEELVAPLLRRIGECWYEGTLRPAHEHLATAVVRRVLEWMIEANPPSPGAPVMIAATPQGQRHELGAMMAAMIAAVDGWRVVYLGPDLPAQEISDAARAASAQVVAMSVVCPIPEADIGGELRQLANALPHGCTLLVGGAASGSYADVLDPTGARRMTSMRELRPELQVFESSEGAA